jgi:hypothetical protein
LAALKNVLDEMEITELKDCADYIQFQLGDGKDDKMQPFYYKEYSEDKKPVVHFFYSQHYNHSSAHIQGIFQSYLVTYMLATHITQFPASLQICMPTTSPLQPLCYLYRQCILS